MRSSNRRARGWASSLAGGLILLALTLGGAAAWSRVVGTDLDLQIGPYHVLSRIMSIAGCRPLGRACPPGARANPRGAARYYTIWLLRSRELRVGSGLQIQLESAPLVAIPIRP